MSRGFSLVELSIVLVILGLLTGGILAGQSLIRAAELRAVTTERDRYITAARTFRDKYFTIPGDMANATSFWGKDNVACTGHTGTTMVPGTCNGDGDGILEYGAASVTNEMFQFWKQLALAGMIEGSYSGLAGSAAGQHSVFGTNAPRSRLNRGGWTTYNLLIVGHSAITDFDYGNELTMGAENNSSGYGPVLKPEEAWNIDTKTDDGKPQRGNTMAVGWDNCTTAANSADLSSDYALTTTSSECAMIFPKAFY